MLEQRRLPVGADLVEGGVHFRVWAPGRDRIAVCLEGGGETLQLTPEPSGHFSALAPGLAAGARYRYLLDGEGPYPDPASRFQPEGAEGPSQVVDPGSYRWRDGGWLGPRATAPVFYELHVGTFTPEGTWAAAAAHLPRLAELGIDVLEVLPVAEWAGEFGWGYDGVDLFAPTHLYGTPDDFRAFVDAAHGLGLAVVLDVVYNHFGPRGCFVGKYTPSYFTARHANEWGDAINFDGPGAEGVRELVVANAGYWIEEMHLDGLRLDATHSLHDASRDHVVAAIVRRARAAAGGRRVLIVAEDEAQTARQLRAPETGGYGVDASWNDDFHHAARVAATGRREAYYSPYFGSPQELISAVRRGWLYQGQLYPWQGKRRGTPALDLSPSRFVTFLENHDQVANSGRGLRLHQLTSPGRLRALTALLLLAPSCPLLFQGQEHASSAPWLFFADHPGELGRQVREGRRTFLGQFPTVATPEAAARLADPTARETFAACKLDHGEREGNRQVWELHRDLLWLRRDEPVFTGDSATRRAVPEGAVLSAEAFVLRFSAESGKDHLLLVNLGRDLHLPAAPEPLLAPPDGRRWRVRWSSEDPRYGGAGTPAVDSDSDGWRLPAEAAVVLAPAPASTGDGTDGERGR
jgi:maltooligosyltrehalose trehalohydrolase